MENLKLILVNGKNCNIIRYNTIFRIVKIKKPTQFRHLQKVLGTLIFLAFLLVNKSVWSQTGISSLNASYTNVNDATNDFSNTGNGTNGAYAAGTTYNMTFSSASTTNNDYLINPTNSFVAGGNTFNAVGLVDTFFVRRNGLTNGNAFRQIIWFEEETASPTGTNGVELNPTYSPTVEDSFRSFRLNIGSDNTFVNSGSAQSNNIERLDYVNTRALTTATPNNAGFAVFERNGNDPFIMAAVTGIDVNGNPTAFGSLLSIPASAYNGANLKPVDYVIFQKQDADTNLKPAENGGTQNVKGIFISFTDLGIIPNQVIYGYIVMPNDATSVDYTTNPTNTGNTDGGMDAFPGGGFFDWDGGLVFVAPLIIANMDDFTGSPILNSAGGTTATTFGNDTLDGIAFADSDVIPTITNNNGITGLIINSNGTLTIPSGTATGSYTIEYQICDANYPANCDTASVLILVVDDFDGDGIDDITDLDDDNDGLLDIDESGGNFPDGDEDGDGIPNWNDNIDNGTGDGSATVYADTNGDGVPDVYDFNNDGIPNHLDLDSDSDGCFDALEGNGGILASQLNLDGSINNPVNDNGIPVGPGTAGAGTTGQADVSSTNPAITGGQCGADLSITKTIDNATPRINETITFTITLTNSGPFETTGVQVRDMLPSGLIYDVSNSTIPPGTTYNTGTGIWDLGTEIIADGAIYILEIAAKITPACGDITNNAEIISSNNIDPDSTFNNGN